jgi:hypothetical protein
MYIKTSGPVQAQLSDELRFNVLLRCLLALLLHL